MLESNRVAQVETCLLPRKVDVPYGLGVEYEADSKHQAVIANLSLIVEHQMCASHIHGCDAYYPTDSCVMIAAIVVSLFVLKRGRKDRDDRLTQTITQ